MPGGEASAPLHSAKGCSSERLCTHSTMKYRDLAGVGTAVPAAGGVINLKRCVCNATCLYAYSPGGRVNARL